MPSDNMLILQHQPFKGHWLLRIILQRQEDILQVGEAGKGSAINLLFQFQVKLFEPVKVLAQLPIIAAQ
jgi:hypothetical protein